MATFSLSANIEEGFAEGIKYIVTPNAQKVVESIVSGYQTGIHSYTVIGTYGTGKSSFLLALEEDLKKKTKNKLLFNPDVLGAKKFETLKIVGDYQELSLLLSRKLNVEGTTDSILDELRTYYNKLHSQNKFLVIFIDEFGKILEHAAKNNPDQEIYFMQKLSEFVNVPTRNILMITTLHQNFSAYARKLNQEQKNEWTKVKGRFQEVVFVEPVEQLLYLASDQIEGKSKEITNEETFKSLFDTAIETNFIDKGFDYDAAKTLYPLDPFSSYVLTRAIQKYGQNERSLFTFLNARGANSLSAYEPKENVTYNLQNVYDYIVYNFYSYLKDANTDSMQWSSMQIAIERVEGQQWPVKSDMVDAIKLVKTIGLLNLFGSASFTLNRTQLAEYAENALGIKAALALIQELEAYKIIRYAQYKKRLILFEGTDINIEEEVSKAGTIVPKYFDIDKLGGFFNKRIAPVKATYYQNGTPRYFEYQIRTEAEDIVPIGDVDGYIQMIFSQNEKYLQELLEFSNKCEHAIIFAYFNNTDEIASHLYNIDKYEYILRKVLIDKSDRVAITEVNNLMEYEKLLLNKSVSKNLYSFNNDVTWLYKGEERNIHSQRDFNQLLSEVCHDVYSKTPIMNNELFNKNKLSGSISAAKAKYLTAMLEHSEEEDFGFDKDKFPPEKTIYYSLLKKTGLHINGQFQEQPANDDIKTLWNECNEFLKSTTNKPRKISELSKKLLAQPFKLKQGFLDFWIPTFLFIKREDYALYGSNGAYIPTINMEFFELLQKHPGEYLIKAFDVSGVKVKIFNQYRKFLNVGELGSIKSKDFIETIKPFFFFYSKQLNDYAKHTQKFNHTSTQRFRDVLARAKDPEKTFFEDLPEALGYNRETLQDPQKVKEFCYVVNRAVKELRSCYNDMIDRIESRLIETLNLESGDYADYILEIRRRLSNVKDYLLTGTQKEFYNHALAEFDQRKEWYQSICYTALDKPLERLRDDEEDKLINDLIYLFRECEKYADISKIATDVDSGDEYFAFDLVSNCGNKNLSSQTYRLAKSEQKEAKKLETSIEKLLSEACNDNVSICTLLKVLNKKLS